MKNIVLALALSVPFMALADELEMPAGCVYNGTRGHCIVENKTARPMTCNIEVTGFTASGARVGNTRRVVIDPKRFETVKIAMNTADSLKHVQAVAYCQ